MIDTIDLEKIKRLPDILGGPLLARMRHAAQTEGARGFEYPTKLFGRVTQLGGVKSNG